MIIEESKGKLDNISLEGILEPADVLLVISPAALITMPSLGVHLLKASCQDAGIKTGVLYSNLIYSHLIGADLHKAMVMDEKLLLSERIFAYAAFQLPSLSIARFKDKFFDPAWAPDHAWQTNGGKVPEPVVPFRQWLDNLDLEELESLTTQLLHRLARHIVNSGYRIVGCSNTLGGIVPAVALLNCVKQADPKVITILGGSLCESEMAEGIRSLNADIDYIFSGEGEITFPVLAKQILEGPLPTEKIIYGQDVIDLDTLPLPDYRDYVKQREKFYPRWPSGKNKYAIVFETSRGCWYGKCSFCGLNGRKNLLRRKSPDTVIKNLKALMALHNNKLVALTDTMPPFQYFNTLIPRLFTELPSVEIFTELSADLNLDQVITLKKAGFMFGPGMETLSPSLLRKLDKPYTVRGNIALLRYARSNGIHLEWAFLFGFPGDEIGEYEEMLDLIPLLHHLPPPRIMQPLILCRFSPYQRKPETFGMSDFQPAEVHRDTLPPHADIDKIAYYFSARFPSRSRENPAVISALWEKYRAWYSAWGNYRAIHLETLLPSLHVIPKTHNRYILVDTRGLPNRPEQMEINREQAGLLLVARLLEDIPANHGEWAVNAGLAVVRESWFIPLATAEPALLQEFEREYQRTGRE